MKDLKVSLKAERLEPCPPDLLFYVSNLSFNIPNLSMVYL
jgi:hypothetical protein